MHVVHRVAQKSTVLFIISVHSSQPKVCRIFHSHSRSRVGQDEAALVGLNRGRDNCRPDYRGTRICVEVINGKA